mmetsp:Transcript_27310/g.58487  ORF Transcript_27310/g.58487 Transcript_27310/m.58487 type:complete len:117 (+) Transcript_27310:148-498(+)
MLQLLTQRYWLLEHDNVVEKKKGVGDYNVVKKLESMALPELEVTPDVGLLHPLLVGGGGGVKYAANPRSYMEWRLSSKCANLAKEQNFQLAPNDAPRVASSSIESMSLPTNATSKT